jgi:hypothetical protein
MHTHSLTYQITVRERSHRNRLAHRSLQICFDKRWSHAWSKKRKNGSLFVPRIIALIIIINISLISPSWRINSALLRVMLQ